MATNLIAPSILSCNFAKLGEEVAAVEKAGADWLHVDVMDGHFVDNLTFGPPVIKSLKKCTSLPLDVHLMIERPEISVSQYIEAGATSLTIHVESSTDPGTVLRRIKGSRVRPGITLRPQTALKTIYPYLSLVELVLVMTVTPGWGGQNFMDDQIPKIKEIHEWSKKNNPKLFIEVDGGINPKTAEICRQAGANVFVAGHAIFKSSDYKKAVSDLRGGP